MLYFKHKIVIIISERMNLIMRKRIVGLLLLVAMLITAIPVMTAAEEVPAAEKTETVTYVDLHTLYVQDGLQSLFSVFGNRNGVDLTAGKWKSKIGTGVATFGNCEKHWKERDNGAVGYDMYFGTYIKNDAGEYVYDSHTIYEKNDDGSFKLDSKGNRIFSHYAHSNYFDYGTQLTLGIDLLPEDDFTLEYLAEHKPYYVTDGNGNLVLDENGKPYETYNVSPDHKMPQHDPGNSGYNAVIRVGYLQGFTYNYDGAWNNALTQARFSGTQWKISGGYVWSRANSSSVSYYSGSNFFLMNEGVRTYAITRDETSATTATYVMLKDGAVFTTTKFDVAGVRDNGNGYAAPDFSIPEKDAPDIAGVDSQGRSWSSPAAKQFWLAERHGTDFYAVRIYNRVLTEEERIRNRTVDVMLYYGLKLPIDSVNVPVLSRIDELLASERIVSEGYDQRSEELQTAIDNIVAHEKIARMYVQREHITAFFSAFDAETVSLNGGKGTWQSLVGTEVANLSLYSAAKTAWVYDGKTVGLTHFYGQLGADKTTLTNSASTNTVGGSAHLATRLDLGLSLLPKEDFTIDYVAQYNPIYVATTDGKVATFTEEYVTAKSLSTSLIGTPMEYFLATGNGVPSAQYQGNYDFIGFIASRPVYLDGTHSHHKRGNVCWTLSDNKHTWDAACDWVGGSAFNAGLRGSQNIREVGTTRSYAIMRDETLTVAEDGARTVTAVYSLWKNGVIPHAGYKSPVLSTANTAKGMYYWDKDDTGNFYLAAANSIDFYTLRIYDTTLTGAEMDHNRAIDLLRFYEVDLTNVANDVDAFDTLCKRVASEETTFERDPLAWEAKHTYWQSVANFATISKELLTRYAAPEHLTALFTTFAPLTVNLSAGTWTDLVSGATATLGNKTYWRVDETSGAVGFNTFYGQFTNGEFDATTSLGSNANTVVNTGTRLEFNISLLPQEDFSVEYTAMYKPVYVYDASEADLIAKEGKTKLESYSYSRVDYGGVWDKIPVDNLGWFQSVTTGLDTNANYSNFVSQTSYKTEEGQNLTRGSLHWVFGQQNGDSSGWYTAAQAFWMGKTRLVTDGLNIVGNVFQTNNEVRTYAISVDESITSAGHTTALFSLHRDTEFYNSNEAVGELNTSAKGYADGGYYTADTPYDSKCRFWLSAMRPTDFFGVRIYDKVLTGEEMARNRFVDLVYYYELEMPESAWQDEMLLKRVINTLAESPFAVGDEKKTQKKTLQDALDTLLKNQFEDNDYAALYVSDGLVGLFTDFTDADGVDVANSTWRNQIVGYGDATFRGTYWENREKGVGYTMHHNEWYTDVGHKSHGLSLPSRYEHMDDFTVEAFATVVGPTDDNGDRWVRSGQPYINFSSSFRFGMLQALFFGNVTSTGGGFALRWNLWQIGWDGSSPSATEGKTLLSTDVGWRQMGGFMVPTAGIMQITKDTTRTDGTLNDIAYNIAYNNAAGSTCSIAKGSFTLEQYYVWESAYTPTQMVANEAAGRFSLFNAMPATVYAIRVYDRVLTAEEKAQNRLADLLYYHDVKISGDVIEYLRSTPEAMNAVAKAASGIKISADETVKSTNKTNLENALAVKQIIIETSDGTTVDMHFAGDKLVLPKTTNNKKVAAWVIGAEEVSYIPGTSVAVDTNTKVRAVLVDSPKTSTTVSVKTSTVADDIAMRFTASISRKDFEAIARAYGSEKISVGMLITPAKYVELANGVFTREALRAMVDEKSTVENAHAYINVVSYGGFYSTDENTMTIAGSIYRFSDATKAHNPAFAAIAFVDVDTNGDLAPDFTLYGDYNPAANHKVMDTFMKARPFMTTTQQGWIDSLLKSFGA